MLATLGGLGVSQGQQGLELQRQQAINNNIGQIASQATNPATGLAAPRSLVTAQLLGAGMSPERVGPFEQQALGYQSPMSEKDAASLGMQQAQFNAQQQHWQQQQEFQQKQFEAQQRVQQANMKLMTARGAEAQAAAQKDLADAQAAYQNLNLSRDVMNNPSKYSLGAPPTVPGSSAIDDAASDALKRGY